MKMDTAFRTRNQSLRTDPVITQWQRPMKDRIQGRTSGEPASPQSNFSRTFTQKFFTWVVGLSEAGTNFGRKTERKGGSREGPDPAPANISTN